MLDLLKRDFAILHASTQDLSDRTRNLAHILERVEVLTASMKQLSHGSSSPGEIAKLFAISTPGKFRIPYRYHAPDSKCFRQATFGRFSCTPLQSPTPS